MAISVAKDFLYGNPLAEALQRVIALKTFELSWRVLVQELVNGEVATTDLDNDLASLDLDEHALRAKFVHAFRLPHEHDLEFFAIRIVVYVLSKLGVDGVSPDRDVDRNARFQIENVRLKRLDLGFEVSNLLEELQAGLVGLEAFDLDALDVVGGGL